MSQSRQPPGVPSGGQFTASAAPESDVALRFRDGNLASVEVLEDMIDPRSALRMSKNAHDQCVWTGMIDMAHLVTDADAINETVASGRVSETPHAPIELCRREGFEGRFEIVDGHHRLADALRQQRRRIEVVVYDYIDDEPYDGPYADFGPPPTSVTPTCPRVCAFACDVGVPEHGPNPQHSPCGNCAHYVDSTGEYFADPERDIDWQAVAGSHTALLSPSPEDVRAVPPAARPIDFIHLPTSNDLEF